MTPGERTLLVATLTVASVTMVAAALVTIWPQPPRTTPAPSVGDPYGDRAPMVEGEADRIAAMMTPAQRVEVQSVSDEDLPLWLGHRGLLPSQVRRRERMNNLFASDIASAIGGGATVEEVRKKGSR